MTSPSKIPDPFGLVGQVLDKQFRVDAPVGEGGFSVVYRGHSLGLNEPIAIKCLKLSASLGSALVENFLERFRSESRILYHLSLGNLSIVRSLGSGLTIAPATSALVPYMALEWLEGESLEAEFERRRAEGKHGRPLAELVALLEPAVLAVAYAHSRGVVHRDLNPGNVIFAKTRSGVRAKVLDFGLAKVVDEAAFASVPKAATFGQFWVFSPAYAAPEQFDRTIGAIGPQTDVYTLAMVLLEGLRDKPPTDGAHVGELMIRALDPHVRTTPRTLGIDVGPRVEQLFARAGALKPSDRPADAGVFWRELREAMEFDATGRASTEPLSPTQARGSAGNIAVSPTSSQPSPKTAPAPPASLEEPSPATLDDPSALLALRPSSTPPSASPLARTLALGPSGPRASSPPDALHKTFPLAPSRAPSPLTSTLPLASHMRGSAHSLVAVAPHPASPQPASPVPPLPYLPTGSPGAMTSVSLRRELESSGRPTFVLPVPGVSRAVVIVVAVVGGIFALAVVAALAFLVLRHPAAPPPPSGSAPSGSSTS